MTRTLARLLPVLLALLVLAPPAHAFRLGGALDAVQKNPADGVAGTIEPSVYDHATRCLKTARPGMVKLQRWLETHAAGVSWGTYRCELWGRGEASLHAEGRALDWHLDVDRPADRAEARRLIRLLLAPDRDGNPQALARRMGVEELIWDCSYWSAGSTEFTPYSPCFGRDGTPRTHVNKTIAHRDHVHIGLTKAGAMGRTSFWTKR